MRRTAGTLLVIALLASVWLVAAAAESPTGSVPRDGGGGGGGEPQPSAPPVDRAWPAGRRVVHASFDSTPLGALRSDDVAREFGQERRMSSSGLSRGSVVPDRSGDGRVLRLEFPAGSGGGAQWEVQLPGRYDRACLSYRVRFSPGFEFSKGGKLPGLAGVAEGYVMAHAAGGNDSDETPPDDGPDGENAWSSRMMWRDGGAAVTYLYAPDWNARHEYGENKPWGRRFQDGRFHTVETCVTMNTPGRHDGAIRTRFDGRAAYRHDAMRFRDTNDLGVNVLFFSTFRGGNDSSWYSDHDAYIEFDDFVVTVMDGES